MISTVFAWWSATVLFDSTHHKLTESSINILGSSYPDINKFNNDICDWTSGTTDDSRAHNGNSTLNGGPIELWWYNAQQKYKAKDFATGDWSAYYYVSLMMHLIEDQAVPAHASEILHGTVGWMDNMEQLAYYNYNPNITGTVAATNPTNNYYAMKYYTLEATADDYWRQYWVFGTVGVEHSGNYGGPPNDEGRRTDVFPTSWSGAGETERVLMRQLLGAAVTHTAGALISVSKLLPPLIKTFTFSNQVIGPNQGTNINFKVIENRTDKVYYTLEVFKDGTSQGKLRDNESVNLGLGQELPKEVDVTPGLWDGKIGGSMLADGNYTMQLSVKDDDGNPEDSVIQDYVVTLPFTIDTTPPVKVTPPLQQISSGLIKPYKIEIKNKYENAEIHSIEIVGDGTPGWTIGALNPNTPSINIPAGTTNTMTFNVTNNSAVSNMIIKVKVTAKGETKTVECIASVSGERVNDNPDDTYSVSSPQYPGTWLYDSESEIGILSNGWGIGLGYLLGNKGIATCVVKDDLTILNEPGRSINDLKVLLIGSAGLMGLDSSATFKQKLAEYLHYIFNGYLKKTIILSRDI